MLVLYSYRGPFNSSYRSSRNWEVKTSVCSIRSVEQRRFSAGSQGKAHSECVLRALSLSNRGKPTAMEPTFLTVSPGVSHSASWLCHEKFSPVLLQVLKA